MDGKRKNHYLWVRKVSLPCCVNLGNYPLFQVFMVLGYLALPPYRIHIKHFLNSTIVYKLKRFAKSEKYLRLRKCVNQMVIKDSLFGKEGCSPQLAILLNANNTQTLIKLSRFYWQITLNMFALLGITRMLFQNFQTNF